MVEKEANKKDRDISKSDLFQKPQITVADNLKISINQLFLLFEGFFWALFDGLTTTFTIPLILLFTQNSVTIGIVSALPYIAILFSQFPYLIISKHIEQKKLALTSGLIAKLVWYPLLFYLAYQSIISLKIVVLYLAIYWFFQYLAYPAWTYTSAKIVSQKMRGRVFAVRNYGIYIAFFITMVLGGMYLDAYKKHIGESVGALKVAFIIMFLFALIFGVFSILCYSFITIKDAKSKIKSLNFLTKMDRTVLKYTLATIFANFAIMIASPFFTVKLLSDLQLSYTFYAVVNAVSILVQALAFKHWGDLIDKYGNKIVITTSLLGVSALAFMFFPLTRNNIWLAAVAFFIGGIGWAGFNLASFSMLLKITQKGSRAASLASFNFYTSLPLIIGPIIGGYVVKYFSLNTIFLVGGTLRLLAIIPFIFIDGEAKLTKEKTKHYLHDLLTFKHANANPLKMLFTNMHYFNKYFIEEVDGAIAEKNEQQIAGIRKIKKNRR